MLHTSHLLACCASNSCCTSHLDSEQLLLQVRLFECMCLIANEYVQGVAGCATHGKGNWCEAVPVHDGCIPALAAHAALQGVAERTVFGSCGCCWFVDPARGLWAAVIVLVVYCTMCYAPCCVLVV